MQNRCRSGKTSVNLRASLRPLFAFLVDFLNFRHSMQPLKYFKKYCLLQIAIPARRLGMQSKVGVVGGMEPHSTCCMAKPLVICMIFLFSQTWRQSKSTNWGYMDSCTSLVIAITYSTVLPLGYVFHVTFEAKGGF